MKTRAQKMAIYLISIYLLAFFVAGIFILFRTVKNDKIELNFTFYNDKGLTDTSVEELDKLINRKKSFLLFVYNDFCSFSVPCDNIFDEGSKELNMQILQIPYRDFKGTTLNKTVKYAPTVIIVKEGKVIRYLDAESNSDKKIYQNVKKFKKFILKYVKEKEKK
jgi:hypothetical protein